MPTIDQIKEYFSTLGIPLPPDFILEAWLAEAASIEACMIGAGYTPAQTLMIYTYLLGLFGIANGDKYISSQSAHGVSQSFRYKADVDKFNGIRSMLRGLDKSGCTNSLIPSIGAKAFFAVVTGGGCCK